MPEKLYVPGRRPLVLPSGLPTQEFSKWLFDAVAIMNQYLEETENEAERQETLRRVFSGYEAIL